MSVCNAGDLSLIPGSGRSPGEGNGSPLQYSCLENPTDGGYSPWNFPDQNTVVGRQTFPSPGYLPNPGIKPRTPALQTDTLPSEPPGKLPSNSGLKNSHGRKSFLHSSQNQGGQTKGRTLARSQDDALSGERWFPGPSCRIV